MSAKMPHSFIVTLRLPDSDSGYVYSEAEHKEYIEDRLDLWAEDGYTVTPAQPLIEKLAFAVEALEKISVIAPETEQDFALWILAKIRGEG